jgi:hypothetical protein
MAVRWTTGVGLLALLGGGCATPQAPTREIGLVAAAFEQLDAASQPLLDDLALAEREQGRDAALDSAIAASQGRPRAAPCDAIGYAGNVENEQPVGPGVIDGFCADDAPYFADLADPPATAAFRRGLKVLGDYTTLLVILAEGRNIDAANAQLHSLATNLGATAGAAGAVAGVPASAGLAPVLDRLMSAIEPLARRAAERGNIEELERLVVMEAPKVEAVLGALRDGLPVLFDTLVRVPMARLDEAMLIENDRPANAGIAEAEVARIEGYRAAVSNLVLLLGQYDQLLHDLIATYDTPHGSITLAALTERAGRLAAGAEAWRRTLASLRAGIR